jgi:pimeloyl-ACP methyl ester carboxylesterase
MAQIKKAYVDLPEGQIHYRYLLPQKLTSKLPIVFLHKSASSSISCTKLMHHYASTGYNTYALDLPGFGQSFDPISPPDQPLTTPWYAKILHSALTQLDLGKYHLVGHHSGAVLSIELAIIYPDDVQSISLIGASIMTAEERAAMKEVFFAPFNEPLPDGSHLLKTWAYLQKMGCPSTDLSLLQREFLDHARAWKGRNQIYGAVWEQDAQTLYLNVKCPILVMCARDDVLWEHYHHVKEMRSDVRAEVVGGANFSLDLDASGVSGFIDDFLEKLEDK